METKFRTAFEKDIESIANQDILSVILEVIERVEEAKKPQDILNLKKLKGSKTAYRIKIGRFRIGIYIDKGVVEFTRVLPRGKIYHFFPE